MHTYKIYFLFSEKGKPLSSLFIRCNFSRAPRQFQLVYHAYDCQVQIFTQNKKIKNSLWVSFYIKYPQCLKYDIECSVVWFCRMLREWQFLFHSQPTTDSCWEKPLSGENRVRKCSSAESTEAGKEDLLHIHQEGPSRLFLWISRDEIDSYPW